MGKQEKSIFSKEEREAILRKPFNDAVRGKKLQQEKWYRIWAVANKGYMEEFAAEKVRPAKAMINLFLKQDKYAKQLHVLSRCPKKEDGETLTLEELLLAEHPSAE